MISVRESRYFWRKVFICFIHKWSLDKELVAEVMNLSLLSGVVYI